MARVLFAFASWLCLSGFRFFGPGLAWLFGLLFVFGRLLARFLFGFCFFGCCLVGFCFFGPGLAVLIDFCLLAFASLALAFLPFASLALSLLCFFSFCFVGFCFFDFCFVGFYCFGFCFRFLAFHLKPKKRPPNFVSCLRGFT